MEAETIEVQTTCPTVLDKGGGIVVGDVIAVLVVITICAAILITVWRNV